MSGGIESIQLIAFTYHPYALSITRCHSYIYLCMYVNKCIIVVISLIISYIYIYYISMIYVFWCNKYKKCMKKLNL